MWWTKQHWERFFYKYFSFLLSFHKCSIIIFMYTLSYNKENWRQPGNLPKGRFVRNPGALYRKAHSFCQLPGKHICWAKSRGYMVHWTLPRKINLFSALTYIYFNYNTMKRIVVHKKCALGLSRNWYFTVFYKYILCNLNHPPSRLRFHSVFKQVLRWFPNSKLLLLLHSSHALFRI